MKYSKETVKGLKSKIPKIQSFTTVKQCVVDTLTTAKLHFFVTQAKVMKPYLEKYQTDNPMVVYMAEDLKNLLKTVMEKFVKKRSWMQQHLE